MLKKYLSLSLLLISIITLGFGCNSLSQQEQVAVKAVTLNYWTVFDDTTQLKAFAEAFRQTYPQIKINIRKVRIDEFENLFTNALADDVAPDIVSIQVRDLRKYQNRLAVAPASATIARQYTQGEYFKETLIEQTNLTLPSAFNIKNNFVATVFNDVVIGGKVYGLPLALDTLALYYNKDILDKAGVPEAPKNWEEFMDAVKKTVKFKPNGDILQSAVALGTGNNITRAFDILSLFMMQSGVKIAQGSTVTFASGLDKNPSLEYPIFSALRFYTDFAQPTKDVYTWNEKMPDALTEFVRGRSAFYFGFAYDYPTIRNQAPQMNLEIIPVPQLNTENPVNIANYWVEAVPKKAKNQNEAWGFVQFMTSPDNIKKYTLTTRQPTPLRSQIKDQQSDLVLAPFVSQILQSENWYRGRNIEAVEKAFTNLIHDYLQPMPTGEGELKRDVNLVTTAAKVIQQTM